MESPFLNGKQTGPPLKPRRSHSIILSICALLPISILLIAGPGFAREASAAPFRLDPEIEQYTLSQVEIYEDATGELTIKDIIKPEIRAKFQKTDKTNKGFTNSAFWIRLDLRNTNPTIDKWLLEIEHPVLDHVDLFIPTRGSPAQGDDFAVKRNGDGIEFHVRELKRRTAVFPLTIRNGESKFYYLRIASSSTVNIPLVLWSDRAYAAKDSQENFFFGIYYGLILVMALYNLFLFIYLWDYSYLFYVLYIIAFGIFQMTLNGLAFQYLWPSSTYLASDGSQMMIPLVPAFILQFTRYFMIARENAPRLDKIMNIMSGIGFLLTIISALAPISAVLRVLAVYAMACVPLSIASGVVVLRRGYRPARYYLIAWAAMFVGGILYGLKSFGVLPANAVTNYSMQIGAAMEVVLLSLGLAYRINRLKEEKETAQQAMLESRKVMMDSFFRFVPEPFLNFLGKDNITDVNLGDAVEKNTTVFFNDIRDFTTLSEEMTTEENFYFLNSYLKRMGPLIQSNRGFIDKFMGDAIMAIFPDTADSAVRAAIQMRQELVVYNAHRAKQGYRPIDVGIGIHSGATMLGTVGSFQRLNTTVIGDTVNLAARLESLTKKFKAPIIISEETYQQLEHPETFQVRKIGLVRVKGKTAVTNIYEVVDGDQEGVAELKRKTTEDFEKGIGYFQRAMVEQAAECFESVLKACPEDRVAEFYLEKCRQRLAS